MTDHVALIVVRTAVLLVGALLTVGVFWRYRRQGLPRIYLLLSAGFGLIALGALIEGVLFEVLRMSLLDVHTVESAFTAAGLGAVLLAILWGTD